LGSLPIDGLKLDSRFVAQIEQDAEARSVCSAVIAIARSFGLRSIATGVETTGQLEFLQECHCDAAQGALFSEPYPLQHFLAKSGAAPQTASSSHSLHSLRGRPAV
jgi:EAL domain-containing protein (putative c-di-GMP-specific phosphodiesterase class I)